MFRKTAKVAAAVTVLGLATACVNGDDNGGGEAGGSYTWGSASTGSDSFVMVEALTSTGSNHTDDSHSAISTAGSVENTVLVSDGDLEFGSSTSDTLYAAANATGPFEDELELQQVMSFAFWTVSMVAPTDSDIEHIDDLRGESVAVGNAGQSSAQMMEAIFEQAGLIDEVDFQYIDGQDAADAMASGQIAASTVSHLGGENITPAFTELAQTIDFEPIAYDDDALEAVLENNPSLMPGVTSSETLEAYTSDIDAPATSAILVVDSEVEEETVYEVLKAILENVDEVQSVAPNQLAEFSTEIACESLVDFQPVHAGAQRYFEEEGIC